MATASPHSRAMEGWETMYRKNPVWPVDLPPKREKGEARIFQGPVTELDPIGAISKSHALRSYGRGYRRLVKKTWKDRVRKIKEAREQVKTFPKDIASHVGKVLFGKALKQTARPSRTVAKAQMAAIRQLPQGELDNIDYVSTYMLPMSSLGGVEGAVINPESKAVRFNVHPDVTRRIKDPSVSVFHEIPGHAKLEAIKDDPTPEGRAAKALLRRARQEKSYMPSKDEWPDKSNVPEFYAEDPTEEVSRGMETLASPSRDQRLENRGNVPRGVFTPESIDWMFNKFLSAEANRLAGDNMIRKAAAPDIHTDAELLDAGKRLKGYVNKYIEQKQMAESPEIYSPEGFFEPAKTPKEKWDNWSDMKIQVLEAEISVLNAIKKEGGNEAMMRGYTPSTVEKGLRRLRRMRNAYKSGRVPTQKEKDY